MESNKTPGESNGHQQKSSTPEKTRPTNFSPEKKNQADALNKPGEKFLHEINLSLSNGLFYVDTTKTLSNKFLEMNVDGNGSISSSKSSIKRRAPTAPHISQHKSNPVSMFTVLDHH